MEKKELIEEILRLARSALETGHVETLTAETAELEKRDPKLYASAMVDLSEPQVEHLLDYIREAPEEFRPQIVRTFWWVAEVINRAKLGGWDSYCAFANASKPILAFEWEMYRKILPDGFLRIQRDFSNIDQVLQLFLDSLNAYKRRIAYLRGLIAIVGNDEADIEELTHRSPGVLEKDLVKDCGPGLVLGSEFIHIRNALAHGSYRIRHRPRLLSFVDRPWEREYSYAEFVAVLHHAWNWMMAWSAAYNFQRLLTARKQYIDPTSFERMG